MMNVEVRTTWVEAVMLSLVIVGAVVALVGHFRDHGAEMVLRPPVEAEKPLRHWGFTLAPRWAPCPGCQRT
jgi:hypothetical protein